MLSILIFVGRISYNLRFGAFDAADFLETKYAEQLKMKTITQEQIDQMKKDAGVWMPDAFLTIELGDGGEHAGEKLTKDTKVRKLRSRSKRFDEFQRIVFR